ncbi:receptor expression-enhancing protein 1-like isoform X2 [Ptychodera flava]|uniref:receptor expression-enhancing protein 1-like isoform X2 n=1 Tax=Ptychodera flava TaxID=63121 RepID=UPI00396A28EC
MVSYIVSRVVVLLFGTLYPAYASYKAVKTRNVKEYVKWMMYWIVFALFTCVETVTDIFSSLIPFYYEAKILFIFWLLSPWTRGSSYIYRKFVHPTLSKKEKEIDEYIATASDKGYQTLKRVSKNGLTIAANAVVTSAIMGQSSLVDHIRQYANSPEADKEKAISSKEEMETQRETETEKEEESTTIETDSVDNRVMEKHLQQEQEEPPVQTRRRRRRDLNKEVEEDSNRQVDNNGLKINMKRYSYGLYAQEGSVKQHVKKHQEDSGSSNQCFDISLD